MKKKSFIFLILILNFAFSLTMTVNPLLDFKPSDIKRDNDDVTLKLSAEQDIYDEWVRTWDSGVTDQAYSIAMDSFENIYIAGVTYTNPPSSLIVKYDKEGNYQWNRTWNTLGSSAIEIALDSSNNIYIVSGSLFGIGDYFCLVKYNSTGDFQWSRTLSLPGNSEAPNDIAIDSLDNIYITGYCMVNPGKLTDAFLIKYNNAGDQQWNRTWGGNSQDSGNGIAFDSSNDIYLTGETSSYGAGASDMLLLKYNSSGTLQWNNTFGTSSPTYPDRGYDLILDSSTNIYVKGMANEVNLVVVKYDNFGTYIWNKTYETYGGFNKDSDIKVDSLGNIFMLSFSKFLKCNSSWDLQWSITPRGVGTKIALDSLNNVYIAGYDSNGLNWDTILTKYSSKPKIEVESPQTGEFFGMTPPNFNITIYEPDVDTTWYSVDGGITNVTFTGSIDQIEQAEWDKLGHGTYNITFYAVDLLGNEGFLKVEINKDITPPEFWMGEPIPNSVYLNNPPNYSIVVDDYFTYNSSIYDHLDSVWYTIDNGLTNISISDPINWVGTINSAAWSNAPIGNITIRFYGSDDFGNIGFIEVIVEKRSENGGDTTTPAIPGFNLLIISSMLSVIIVIILKKQKQK